MKMLYHYYINEHPTRFWHNDTCKIMILQDDNGMDVGEHQIIKTEEGEYFEVDGKKINFMDFICPSPAYLVEHFEKYRDKDLCQVLIKHGMDSVRIMLRKKKLDLVNFGGHIFGFDTSSPRDNIEDYDWVEYKFVNEDFSDPKDNYKLKMVPADEKLRQFYGSERTYVCDLVGLIKHRPDLYQIKANCIA
jgi:hypothetical protein